MELVSCGAVFVSSIKVDESQVVVGRSPTCQHVIIDPVLSRRHVALKLAGPGRLLLQDLSANGVCVNDRFLEKGDTVELCSGDCLSLDALVGRYKFTVRPIGGATEHQLNDTQPLYDRPSCTAATAAATEQQRRDEASQLQKAIEEKRVVEQEKKRVEQEKKLVESELERKEQELNRLRAERESEERNLRVQSDNLERSLLATLDQLTNQRTHLEELMEGKKQESRELSELRQQLDSVQRRLDTATGYSTMLQDQLQENARQLESLNDEQLRERQHNVDVISRLADSEMTCSVCADYFVDAVTLNCGHTFCNACIEPWLSNNRDCPLCRRPVMSRTRSVIVNNLVASIVAQLPAAERERHEQARARAAASATASSSGTARSSTVSGRVSRGARSRGARSRGARSRGVISRDVGSSRSSSSAASFASVQREQRAGSGTRTRAAWRGSSASTRDRRAAHATIAARPALAAWRN